MSIKKSISANKSEERNVASDGSRKQTRFDRCFTFVEVPIESNSAGGKASSLADVDSNKLKAEIKRWAKRVAAYARQLSVRVGNSARSFRSFSSSSASSRRAGSSRRPS